MDNDTSFTAQPSVLTDEEIRRHFAWHRTLMTGGATDKDRATAAIDKLYDRAGLPAPAIFWCQSFYQMLTMPSLVVGILHSDMWELIAGARTPGAGSKQWNQYWNKVWPEIWVNGGMPLLLGMNRTSRIAAHYGHLESALINQTKQELGAALRSGRLDYLQRKLKREIYRIYWARHELANDFAKEHWMRTKHDVSLETVYVRNRFFEKQAWMQIGTLEADIEQLGEGIGPLFYTLANRLGGEPVAQNSFIINVPCDVAWVATASLMLKAFPDEFERTRQDVAIWSDLSQSCSALVCLDGITFLCDKPTAFHLTDRRRLHHESGPALSYSDGFAEYAWQGILVPREVIVQPEAITTASIENCSNAEVRRVMLERYGVARYIIDANIQPVQEDEFGTLYRKELPGDEPLVMVKVVNSTAEPDGSFKDYFLRVPPNVETAKQAVAWTFDLQAQDYEPRVQT